MITTITVRNAATLVDPVWTKSTVELPALKGGDKVKLKVTGKDVTVDNTVHFEVRGSADERVLGVVDGAKSGNDYTAEWVVPMTPEVAGTGATYVFHAILREKPTAANGHLGVLQRVKSPALDVLGTKLTITKIDECFVPFQEKLQVEYKLEGRVPAKGRIEVWGERYPSNKPVYVEPFTFETGDDKKWDKWDGKIKNEDIDGAANAGHVLKDKYLTAEFSPYRVRFIVGPDDDSVKDPWVKGANKVAMVESPFQVIIEHVHIRLIQGLQESVASDPLKRRFKLEHVLKLGNRDAATGNFDASGRLPVFEQWQARFKVANDNDREFDVSTVDAGYKYNYNKTELELWLNETKLTLTTDYEEVEKDDSVLTSKIKLKENKTKKDDILIVRRHTPGSDVEQPARIRVPMARHQRTGEELDMGSTNGRTVADAYLHGGGSTKYDIDKGCYSRPELPVEFLLHLKSRASGKNADHFKGVFEPEAVGPAKIEPVAEDHYDENLFTTGDATHQKYFKNVRHKIKRGKDDAPVNTGGTKKPIFDYWQWREKLTADVDADREFETTTFDDTMEYKVGSKELTVWLNRTLLRRTETTPSRIEADYEEVGGDGTMSKKIKLKKGLAKRDDVIWVVRADPTVTGADKVDRWPKFSPGANCHFHYGGLRGADPSDDKLRLFRKDFSADPTSPKDPIIGKPTTPFPYKDNQFVNFRPDDKAAENEQERVEVTALLAGDQKGRAGIIFSPTVIGGDSYVLKARVEDVPYERNFGDVSRKAYKESKTGPMTVWRWCQIGKSLRCPDMGAKTLRPSVGSDREDPGSVPRTYKGDARNVKLSDMNDNLLKAAFNEWTVGVPMPITAASYVATKPIEITTGMDHGLSTGEEVTIAGVLGNTNANGKYKVTKVDDRKFTLNNRVGNAAYKGGGTVDPVEIHRDMDLEEYITRHDGVTGLGAGAVQIRPLRTYKIKEASNNGISPIEVYTTTKHYFETGEHVAIAGVNGCTAANGTHEVTRLGDYGFSLNGTTSDGNYTNGGTATFSPPAPYTITSATKTNPVVITTSAAHRMNTAERVTVTGVGVGGDCTITKLSDTTFSLDGKDGTSMATYASGGTVESRDHHHRNIRNWFVQYDNYRRRLPPSVDDARKGIATWAINNRTVKGDEWADVIYLVNESINDWNGNPGNTPATTANDYTGVTPIATSPSGWDGFKYFLDALGYFQHVAKAIVNHFTPKDTNPKVMDLVRWPELHDDLTGTIWEGECLGSGQSLILHRRESVTLYSHEMGHSMHLVHFLGGNFGWKHHDLHFPSCMMSYVFIEADVLKPAGGVGVDGGTFASGGWPHTKGSDRAYHYQKHQDAGTVLAEPCARCMLKLQGWDEKKLPVAWHHPDLF